MQGFMYTFRKVEETLIFLNEYDREIRNINTILAPNLTQPYIIDVTKIIPQFLKWEHPKCQKKLKFKSVSKSRKISESIYSHADICILIV